jgi:hypothetical protein
MTENLPANVELLNPDNTTRERLFVTIEGQDWQRSLEELNLTFDSSEQEIMDAIVPLIQEEFNTDIRDLYKIRKATNNQNIFIIPNSTAGGYSKCPRCGYHAFNGYECFDCGYQYS